MLNVRCPPQAHVLNAQSLAGGIFWQGSGNFSGCLPGASNLWQVRVSCFR
jgi:hypothetical protein